MKSIMRVTVLALAVVALAAGPVFSQGFSPKKIWNLTVTVNVPDAVVYVDNVPAPGGVTRVTGGAHNVKVHADGWFDFNGPVVVNGDTTFPVTLGPQGFPLAVRVSVPNARVFVDDAEVTGTVPLVAPGPHSVQVSAPGFVMYNATINVAGPLGIDVVLQPGVSLMVNVNVPNATIMVDNVPIQGNVAFVARGQHSLNVHVDGYQDWNGTVNVMNNLVFPVRLGPAGFLLTVNANVANAVVTVNNTPKGPVPYSEYLPGGTYAIRVSADGYMDYAANIPLNGAVNLSVQLTPSVSTLAFVIPPNFRDPEARPGDPRGQVRIFVDNRLANPDSGLEGIAIAPGRHSVRIASGAFSLQVGDLVVQPGQSYVLELSMDLRVRASSTPQ